MGHFSDEQLCRDYVYLLNSSVHVMTESELWALCIMPDHTFLSCLTVIINCLIFYSFTTPQTLRAVQVLFSPMVSGWVGWQPVKLVGSG